MYIYVYLYMHMYICISRYHLIRYDLPFHFARLSFTHIMIYSYRLIRPPRSKDRRVSCLRFIGVWRCSILRFLCAIQDGPDDKQPQSPFILGHRLGLVFDSLPIRTGDSDSRDSFERLETRGSLFLSLSLSLFLAVRTRRFHLRAGPFENAGIKAKGIGIM